MKRVRCPKCDNYISFDETKYTAGQKLIFQCNDCGKEFAIRIGVSKLRKLQKDENPDEEAEQGDYGSIVVIENVFHYKQIIPLKLGDNFINVSYDKRGNLKYILRDGPSNTGTFVDNEILGDKERRVIEDGSLFTIGATSVILKTKA